MRAATNVSTTLVELSEQFCALLTRIETLLALVDDAIAALLEPLGHVVGVN